MRQNKLLAPIWIFLLLVLNGCTGLVSVSVETKPGPVRAGEEASLDIVLDKAPNFEGGEIRVAVTGPQNSNATLTGQVKTHPGVKAYHVSVPVPASAPGGTWNIAKLTFWTGVQEIQLPFNNQSFQVVANPNLALPTSAQVTVSLSQAQLLKAEAAHLQFRLQILKQNIALGEGNSGVASAADTLRKKIDEELVFLSATESRFQALASSPLQPEAPASVFFGDLRASYEEAKSELNAQSTQSKWSDSFKLANLESTQAAGQQKHFPALAQAVFHAFEQNELAYITVANTGSLTFDLDVSTSPEGATISYRRRGDSYRQHHDQTNSVIRALPYAIWTVRLQKQGYRDEEREHDPFREPNHVINVQLKQ